MFVGSQILIGILIKIFLLIGAEPSFHFGFVFHGIQQVNQAISISNNHDKDNTASYNTKMTRLPEWTESLLIPLAPDPELFMVLNLTLATVDAGEGAEAI